MSALPRRALLDTSALIDPPTLDELSRYADEVAVPAIAIGELHFGITATDDLLEQTRRRQRIQSILAVFEALPFDAATAEFYGTLASLVRAHGRNPRPRRMDLQIAATAVRHDMALVTRNASDFAGLEPALRIIDLDGPR